MIGAVRVEHFVDSRDNFSVKQSVRNGKNAKFAIYIPKQKKVQQQIN